MRRRRLLPITIVAAAMIAACGARAEQQRLSPASPARAVLYEEDTTDPLGKSYAGAVVWRIAKAAPDAGAGVDPAIEAAIEVPERGIAVTFVLRRNPQPTTLASHRVDLKFNLSPAFASGGIQNVPGLLMKDNEQARGAPLASVTVKRDATSFQIDLSAAERNPQLLKGRRWFDLPIVYADGRRAILAFEKGASGEEAFDAVFTAWGQ